MRLLKSSSDWLMPFSLLLLAISLWLPFGFNTGFWADGWPSLVAVEHRISFNASAFVRPLLYLPWWIAHALTPQSLVGSNLVVLFAIFGKGLLTYGIWRKLGVAKYIALVTAALTMVFPVDTGILYMGALAIHFALLSYLGAVYCLISYYLRRAHFWLVPMALCLIVSVGIYETVYPLVLFTPALLLLVSRKFKKHLLVTTALWYVIPLINGLRLLLLLLNSPESVIYQSGLLDDSMSISSMIGSAINNYRKHFQDVWMLNANTTQVEYITIASVAGILLILISTLLFRRNQEREVPTLNLYALLAVYGFLLIGFGFAAYLPTALRDDTTRTFYYSSVGAALTHVCLLQMLTRRLPFGPIVFCVIAGVVLGIGTVRLLEQHQRYVLSFEQQRLYTSEIVEQVGNLESGTAILIIDESPDAALRQVFAGSSFYLNSIIRYAYSDYNVNASLCYLNEIEPWGSFQETCSLNDRDVLVNLSKDRRPIDHTYNHLIVLRYTPETGFMVLVDLSPYVAGGQPDGYNPAALSVFGTAFPPRFLSVFRVAH